MKKVISGNELKIKMKESIDLLCNTVKNTLGPSGSNVIIDHSNFSPYITNDGVTIAENIESDDPIINTILELAKEASINTNEFAGDGTTTTLVLLQSIFNNGLEIINNINPLILKKELEESLNNIIDKIIKESRIPTNDEILKLAITSSNDEIIGKNIYEVFKKIKVKDIINIKENNNEDTTIKYNKGYIFESNLVSHYYFRDKSIYNIKDSFILLVDNNLNYIEEIDNIINEIINTNNNLIILANDYSDNFINEILNLYLESIANIFLFKTPEYGLKQRNILNDISSISNAKIIDNTSNISLNNLGKINYIKFDNKLVTIDFIMNNNIKNRINTLKHELNDYNIDKDFISKELSMFTTGTATIYVGGTTKVERHEKIMRYIDSLCAISSLNKGILPGSGIILDKISEEIIIKTNGDKVLKLALIEPMKQILINSGLNYNKIKNNIINNNYNKLYNVLTNEYEKISDTKVIDSTYVIINSLKNACSIASMLLTTNSLIINEYQNNINKINDYNEL